MILDVGLMLYFNQNQKRWYGIVSVQEVVLELLRENITAKASSSKGVLIDGYPREMDQGIKFEEQVRVQYLHIVWY